MATTVDELLLKISADTQGFSKAMDDVQRKLDALNKKTDDAAEGNDFLALKTGLATAAFTELTRIATQAASAMYGVAVQSWEAIDALGDVALALNTNVASLQRFQYAAALSGSSAEGATALLRGMQVALGNAGQDGDDTAKAFNRLGFSVAALKAMAPEEAAAQLATAVSRLGDASTQADSAMAVFGRGAKENMAFIKQGGENMRFLSEEAEKAGIGLKDWQVKELKDTADKIDGLKLKFESVALTITSDLQPVVQTIVELLDDSTGSVDDMNASLGITSEGVGSIVDDLMSLYHALGAVKDGFDTITHSVSLVGGTMAESVVNFDAWIDRWLYGINNAGTEWEYADTLLEQLSKDSDDFGKSIDKWAYGAGAFSRKLDEIQAKNLKARGDAERERKAKAEDDAKNKKNGKPEGSGDDHAPLPADIGIALKPGELQPTHPQDDAAKAEDSPAHKKAQADLKAFQDYQKAYAEEDMLASDLAKQREEERYNASREALINAKEEGLITEEAYNRQKEQLETDHQLSMTNISGMAMQERARAASQFFGNMASLMQSGNKKLFEIGKVAAIAQATIDMWQSAGASFKFGAEIGGPVLGAAMAASAVVAGAVRISNIARTTMGGGGGGGGGGSGGDGGGGGGGSGVAAAPPPRQTNVNISLQGSSFSDNQVRGLIASIGEAMGDNVKLGVS